MAGYSLDIIGLLYYLYILFLSSSQSLDDYCNSGFEIIIWRLYK